MSFFSISVSDGLLFLDSPESQFLSESTDLPSLPELSVLIPSLIPSFNTHRLLLLRMTRRLNVQFIDFKNYTNTIFGNLREDKDFADVTLACEDGRQIDAHKVILAATSPFFQNLLRRNKHPHPLIFMRNVSSQDLLAVLDFSYNGEANLDEQNLESFLTLAEDLKLEGLSGQTLDKVSDDLVHAKVQSKSKVADSDNCAAEMKSKSTNEFHIIKEEPDFEEEEDQFSNDFDEEKIKSMMEKTQNFMSNGKGKTLSFICKHCGKEGRQKIIKKHIIAQHLAIPCNMCRKKFMSQTEMNSHRQKRHSNLSESQLEHEEKLKSMMTKIQKMIPNGRKQKMFAHSCNMCGKEGNVKTVKDHIEVLHMEKVSLSCNFCEEIFSSRNAVRVHNERRHTDVAKPIFC